MIFCSIFGIYNVVTVTHELITLTFLCTGDGFFNDYIFLHFQRVGVHDHFAAGIVRVIQHHVVVQSCCCLHVVGSAYPVQGAFDFSAFKTTAASCFRVICAVYFYHIAVFVFDKIGACYEVSPFQTNFFARSQTEEFFHRFFHKVFPFDIQFSCERCQSCAQFRIFRVVFQFHHFYLIFRIVGDDQFQRVQNCHNNRRFCFQVVTDTVIQQTAVYHAVCFGYTDTFAEITNGFRCITSAAQTADGGHTRVIPAVNQTVFYQRTEFSLTHNSICHTQTGKFNLSGRIYGITSFSDYPIVQRTVVFKFHGTNGVGNAFDGIFQRMGKVIHRVDAPFCTGCMVCRMGNTIKNRVSHVDVGRSHVDLRTQCMRTVREFPCFHPFKQIQVFFHTTIAVRAFFAGCAQCTSVLTHFFCCQVTYESFAFFDEFHCHFIIFLEIGRSVVQSVFPVEAQPFYVFLNAFYIFHIFFCGVGVVKTQVAFAAVKFCQTKVQANGFCVTNVQIAIGFRRETGMNFIQFPFQVCLDIVMYKVTGGTQTTVFHCFFFCHRVFPPTSSYIKNTCLSL